MDDPEVLAPMLIGLFLLAVFLFRCVRQIDQWEVALKFTFGKFAGRLEPGLNFVIPIMQKIYRVDNRIRNRDLPAQMVITRDNVTATVDAVVYYRVVDAEKAVLNVQNYETAVRDRARVVLRDTIGEITLDELLSRRDEVAAQVRGQVEQFVAQWGLHIESISLQDIQLPPDMQQAIARKAIAERDKQYVIIKSQADLESARNFAEAAKILAESPGALELRRLEALQGITGTGNTKVVFDLAKTSDADGMTKTKMLAMAAAMQDEPTGVRVDASPVAGTPIGADPVRSTVQSESITSVGLPVMTSETNKNMG